MRKFGDLRDQGTQEIFAIREALSWVKDSRLQNVIIESDCAMALSAMNDGLIFNSMYGSIVTNCISFLATLIDVRVCLLDKLRIMLLTLLLR